MRFDWDPEKAETNLKKQRVGFPEAVTALTDPSSATFDDSEHSLDENRWITIGYSETGRLLVVSHADSEDGLRIISAREATRSERKRHEENQ